MPQWCRPAADHATSQLENTKDSSPLHPTPKATGVDIGPRSDEWQHNFHPRAPYTLVAISHVRFPTQPLSNRRHTHTTTTAIGTDPRCACPALGQAPALA